MTTGKLSKLEHFEKDEKVMLWESFLSEALNMFAVAQVTCQ